MTRSRLALAAALAAASALALAGCAGAAATPAGSVSAGGTIAVVASTNVWGSIAQEIGGSAVSVTSLISSAAQDPHAFEPSAQDQLSIKNAGLIIENGGGYDPYMETLLSSAGANAPVITAVDNSTAFAGGSGNEHVWYDPSTAAQVAGVIAKELSTLDPSHASDFSSNLAAFQKQVTSLETSLGTIKTAHAGAQVFVTEPVPVYLIEAAGLVNATPEAFSSAVEQGQDVPPATLLEAQNLLKSGTVKILIANAQTGGAETTAVIDAATTAKIPVLEFSETLPDGQTYSGWMQQNIDKVSAALGA